MSCFGITRLHATIYSRECDASGEGVGELLMQNHHPIAFESRKLKDYERHHSIYDKEMLAILHALTKFKQYLVGSRFKIKTDHNNLKYFLEQKELNERQQKWENISMDFITGLPKLQGRDCLYMVVDWLTKFAHFFAISSDYSAS